MVWALSLLTAQLISCSLTPVHHLRGIRSLIPPLVTKIIAEYLGVPLYEVKKSSAEAVITYGETKVNEGGEE